MAMLLRRKTLWLLPAIAAAIACTASLRALAEPEAKLSQEAPPPASIDSGAFRSPAQILLAPRHPGWEKMVEDRLIRVLVVSNRTHFFLDGARQRGIVADSLSELETLLNRELKLGARRLHLVAIPVRRDQLIPFLEEGRGDIAAANLTITPERLERVDFTVPSSKPLNAVVVTGPMSPLLSSLDDLAGKSVHVRRSSSFWPHLERLNQTLRSRGRSPMRLIAAHEYLETEDLLELTSSGVIPITVADAPLAGFWSDVLPDLVVRNDLVIAEAERIGWAIRKDAMGLKQRIDPWIESNREGRLLGNMLLKRYLHDNRWVKDPVDSAEQKRLAGIFELFQTYCERYDFDWLLVAAQGYQESGLRQETRSRAGAIGIMQVLPSTARDPAVGIEDIDQLEPNIHAGTRYLRHVVDTYFDEPGIDEQNRLLFAFAAYNAGPTRVRSLRRKAAAAGLDSTRWFQNVELMAAREIGRETVQYVANIYKYHVAFELTLEQTRERMGAQAALRESD